MTPYTVFIPLLFWALSIFTTPVDPFHGEYRFDVSDVPGAFGMEVEPYPIDGNQRPYWYTYGGNCTENGDCFVYINVTDGYVCSVDQFKVYILDDMWRLVTTGYTKIILPKECSP